MIGTIWATCSFNFITNFGIIFSLNIPNENPKDIQEISHRFCDEFVPSCKYNLREIPELEYYHDGMTEFMVPIED